MNRVRMFFHDWIWILLIMYCVIGSVYPVIGIAALICMLAPSILAIWKGRFWCGNFCPRGSFNDTVLSKLSRKKAIPGLLKNKQFRILFLIILMGAFSVQLAFAWGNITQIGIVFVRMILITTGITIILGIVYNHRTWCVICPMGTMASWVTKLVNKPSKGTKNITFNQEKCVNCKLCSKACPIGIDVLGYKQLGKVQNSDCIKCNQCAAICPKKALSKV